MRTNADLGLLIQRVSIAGMLLMMHGWEKLVGFTYIAPHFPDPTGLGGTISLALAMFAEFFCAIAVLFGAWTRLAVLPIVATMLVAVLIIHADDPWGKKELALLYLVPMITLFFTGAGKYSVDRFFLNRN